MREWHKYLYALLITVAIFATAITTSAYLDKKRVAEVRSIGDKISVDILSLETQFDLLQESSCKDIAENSVLSQELNSLGRRLSFTEEQLGANDEEVLALKRSYSLLQIKDYLLMKRVAQKCGLRPVFVLYFYSNAGDCDSCKDEGYVLTYLSERYPQFRVYSFDYNLDLSAIRTLIGINDIQPTLPALVINGDTYYGFHDQDAIENILPILREFEKTATTTAKAR